LPNGYKVNASTDEYDRVGTSMNRLSQISSYVVVIAVIASLIIISLIIVLFTRDRKYELGIYLSLGERRKYVFAQIVIELLLIGVSAMLISLVTGNMLGKMVSESLLTSSMLEANQTGMEQFFVGAPKIDQATINEAFRVQYTLSYVIAFLATGIVTILLSAVVPLLYILRLNPKKIMLSGAMNMAILETKDMTYYYQDGENRRKILDKTNISFEKGKFYTILGKSGSGKTTFLSLISALDQPTDGEVFFEEKNIKTIGYEEYRRNKISLIFQSYNLIPYLTALENVLVSMAISDNKLPDQHDQIAYRLLDYIGINSTKADRFVNQLSGGEQQRVAIARALATNVDIILADEPTGNLDEGMEQEIVDIFKELAAIHNKCIIVVTHSTEIAKQSDQTFYLKKGAFTAYE
jgi:putative ABC transport system ATP-binding protein